MKASEWDSLLTWLFCRSRLRCGAAWIASLSIFCLVATYGALTVTDGKDDHFRYSTNQCVFKDDDGKDYYKGKGETPNGNFGKCDGRGVLVRNLDFGRNVDVIKIGIPIALSPFLLVMLNGGVLRTRKTATGLGMRWKTSATHKALDSTKRRRLAEHKSDQMEIELAQVMRELDNLLKT